MQKPYLGSAGWGSGGGEILYFNHHKVLLEHLFCFIIITFYRYNSYSFRFFMYLVYRS
jgi:hypothetical protein